MSDMRRFASIFWRCSPCGVLLLFGFIQGCCGIGGLNESQVRQWIHKGDSGDKVLVFLKSEGFEVDDNRPTSEQARRICEGRRDSTHPSSGWIYGTRLTDVCMLIETHLNVTVGIDANNRVTDMNVMKVVIWP